MSSRAQKHAYDTYHKARTPKHGGTLSRGQDATITPSEHHQDTARTQPGHYRHHQARTPAHHQAGTPQGHQWDTIGAALENTQAKFSAAATATGFLGMKAPS